ncbi:putative lipoprotein [Pseudomonas duriflava]|uniref:Putative lipoprotein n=1 Tax=Pseudomonas duriflava TaxID=459528 RepID=A0A562QPP3_9PSED|nr:putative lipoprotein [Pseudomonas duriflava]
MRKLAFLTLASLLLTACNGALRPMYEPGRTTSSPSPTVKSPVTPQPSRPAVKTRSLEGNAYFDQAEELPPTAKLTISLYNTATGDVPAGRVAQRTLFVKQASPIPFRLDYDPSKVKSGQRYAISARVLLGGRPLYLTPSAVPVTLNGNTSSVKVQLVPAR